MPTREFLKQKLRQPKWSEKNYNSQDKFFTEYIIAQMLASGPFYNTAMGIFDKKRKKYLDLSCISIFFFMYLTRKPHSSVMILIKSSKIHFFNALEK